MGEQQFLARFPCYSIVLTSGAMLTALREHAGSFTQIESMYMHNNPVRQGLCARAKDGSWSIAADHSGTRVGPLPIDWVSLPVPG
jgi:hypothetical protein